VLPSRSRILLVEDDCDQRFLTLRALQRAVGDQASVNCVSSGREAIAYMIGEGAFADRNRHPFPSVVITDLNMHDGDGFEVLEFIRTNSAWCNRAAHRAHQFRPR
jgi:CheY-like chemotaxis protein